MTEDRKSWEEFAGGEEEGFIPATRVTERDDGGADPDPDPGPDPGEPAGADAFGDLTVRLPRAHLDVLTARAGHMGMMPDDYVRYLVLQDLRRPTRSQSGAMGTDPKADRAPVEARVLEEMRIAPGVWFRAANLGKLAGLEEAEARDLLDRIAGSGACETDGAGRYRVLP